MLWVDDTASVIVLLPYTTPVVGETTSIGGWYVSPGARACFVVGKMLEFQPLSTRGVRLNSVDGQEVGQS